MTNSIPHLDQLVRVNDQLLGLPALPLIFIGCIAIGMLLKAIPIYPNNWIPAGVFCTGIVFNLVITPLDNMQDGMRALILGLIAGAGAWIAHRKVVSKWVTSSDLESSETKFIKPNNADDIKLP